MKHGGWGRHSKNKKDLYHYNKRKKEKNPKAPGVDLLVQICTSKSTSRAFGSGVDPSLPCHPIIVLT